MWVCGKELALNEYPWGIDPTKPHEHGEPQGDLPVDEPCSCTPIKLSDYEFNRRRQVVYDELQLDW